MTDELPELRLTNTLTRKKEPFRPLDPKNVRIYVCGPTVYDYAHIGNARPAIVFDVLYRLLRHLYGAEHVTYVRNITDVDDKINARALRDFGGEIAAGRLSLNEAIRKVTEPTFEQYQKDVAALGCLEPTHQPRATDYVLPRADGRSDMVTLIQSLIDRGHAYAAAGEILFDTASMPDYGQLSKRPLDEQQAGARVAVDAHKKNPADFVLWKSSSADEPGWDASFSVSGQKLAIRGRPGWHIECSAMSEGLLWDAVKDRLSSEAKARPHQFDIHGGGLDLIFPHHENEIAQSRCAHGTQAMATVWMHNGFVQVEGRKMSKSEGNFVTIHDLLHTEKFGGRKWPGEVLRLAMLMTHYREPIDFSVRRLEEAESIYSQWLHRLDQIDEKMLVSSMIQQFLSLLADDLDTPSAVQYVSRLKEPSPFFLALHILGFVPSLDEYKDIASSAVKTALTRPDIVVRLRRGESADNIAQELVTTARLHATYTIPVREVFSLASNGVDFSANNSSISLRLAFIRDKNWAEADRIRDELLAQGIQLKDGKDPATGERVTTWEIKR